MKEKSEESNKTSKEHSFQKILVKLETILNFQYQDFKSFDAFVKLLYRPTDPSSIGVIRIFFGMLMIVDVLLERGGLEIASRWGDEAKCYFPLFPFLKPLPFSLMCLVYGILFVSAGFIMIGYKFRRSIIVYCILYWYLFLLDKSYWNNHSYLFGIISTLLLGSSANHFWSVDAIIDPSIQNTHVPYWNYFVLKFQFFLLYFYAGLKKMNFEWLSGYSMSTYGNHWVFYFLRPFLTSEQIELYVIHWIGFLLDLTIGFWMLFEKTRPVAFVFCAMFHLMNSRLFSIGMFPYVCLSTMPLFCENSWPRSALSFMISENNKKAKVNSKCIYPVEEAKKLKFSNNITWKHRLTAVLVLTHCSLQLSLPYTHFITKGYNNWTNGLYGYSWDMMIHAWDTALVVVKVVDNLTHKEFFLDPKVWTKNGRWNKHGDMCLQYAECVKDNLLSGKGIKGNNSLVSDSNLSGSLSTRSTYPNGAISIFIDVWCSLNGRFQQRMFDPNYDLLKAKWSPFTPIEWLLPLLIDKTNYRTHMKEITREVHTWSNISDVLFIADFPGMHLEQFLPSSYSNVSLTVLDGQIFYEVEDEEAQQSLPTKLIKGSVANVSSGMFHRIHTVGRLPSLFMYTYNNLAIEVNGNSEASKDNFPSREHKHHLVK